MKKAILALATAALTTSAFALPPTEKPKCPPYGFTCETRAPWAPAAGE